MITLLLGWWHLLSIPKEDIESVAKNFDEYTIVGVTSIDPFIEYLRGVETVKSETNAENKDFLVKDGYFETLVNPRKIMHDARTLIVLAVYSYDEESTDVKVREELRGKIARTYSYYPVVRKTAEKVSKFLTERGFKSLHGQMVPLKIAAIRAGLGFQGKNTLLITKQYGSWVALRSIITNAKIKPDEPYEGMECGNCVACLRACPTGAIYQPYKVNPKKCINPITRLPHYIPPEIRGKMDAWLLGCDACQEICPKNRFLKPRKRSKYAGFQPEYHESHKYLVNVKESFPKLIPLLKNGESPIIRRNAAIVLGNLGDSRALPVLREQLKKEDDFVKPYIAYAIRQIEASTVK